MDWTLFDSKSGTAPEDLVLNEDTLEELRQTGVPILWRKHFLGTHARPCYEIGDQLYSAESGRHVGIVDDGYTQDLRLYKSAKLRKLIIDAKSWTYLLSYDKDEIDRAN